MKNFKIVIIILLVILLAVSGFFVYKYYQNKKITTIKWDIFTNEEFKLAFNYPDTFRNLSLSDEDKKSKIIFRAEQIDPSALISVRYEEKLGLIKIAQKGTVLETIATNFNNQYPQRYPDFKKESENKTTVDGREAVEFIFTYQAKDNSTRLKQRFVAFLKEYSDKNLGTVAFYFSFQCKEGDFSKLNEIFNQILSSVKLSTD